VGLGKKIGSSNKWLFDNKYLSSGLKTHTLMYIWAYALYLPALSNITTT